MKKMYLLVSACFVLLLAGTSFGATFTDTYDPDDILLNSNTPTLSYTQIISDDGFDVGYDFATSFNLRIDLSDDERDGFESYYFDMPGLLGDRLGFNVNNDINTWSLEGLILINIDGSLDWTLSRLSGDFYFNQSILTVNTCGPDQSAPVPEPATMVLLGLGLLGLAGVSRKKS